MPQTVSTLPLGREQGNDKLIDESSKVLERYEATPGCTLVHAGYIDLFGNVWACVVSGPGWAELSVVRLDGDGQAHTSVAHIDSPFDRAPEGDGT